MRSSRFAWIALLAVAMTTSAFASSTPALSATSVQAASVSLKWTDKSKNEVSWVVERGLGTSGSFVLIATLNSNSTTYVDYTVSPATSYRYRVSFVSKSGARTTSNKITVRTLNPPANTFTPQAAVTSPRTNESVAGTISLSAAVLDNVAVTRVDFFVDDAPVATAVNSPYGTLFDTRTKSDGFHSASVTMYDTANRSASARITFRIDNAPPTIPGNVIASAAGSPSQVSVSWNASSDASGVQAYSIFRNGQPAGTSSTTSFTDGSVAGNVTYCYSVVAVDTLGNASAASAESCATTAFELDFSAPSTPLGLIAVARNCGQIDVSWSPSTDNAGIRSYWLFRNGQVWRQVFAPGTSVSDWTVAASTTYSYTVAAVDSSGNQSPSSVPATAATPSCSEVVPPPSGPTMPGSLNVTASDCTTASLNWGESTAAGGTGLRGYNIYRNNALLKQVGTTSTTDSGLSANSAYIYAVSAVDNAGNESPRTTAVGVTTPACPDTAAPTVPGTLTASAGDCHTATLNWGSSVDSGGSELRGYNVYRNNIYLKQVNTTSTSDTTLSANSTYFYAVGAVDNAGNESPRTAQASVTTPSCADTAAPTTPGALTASSSDCRMATLSWSPSVDSGGSELKGYNVYRNNIYLKQVNTTSTSDTTLSANNTYFYAVSAVDNAGNESSRTAPASVTTPACPDTIAPTTPGALTAGASDCRTAALSWVSSVDSGGSGLKGYNVYRNNIYLKQVSTTSTTDGGLSASSAYLYSVSAVDNAGNESPRTAAVMVTVPSCPDTTAPTVPGNLTANAVDCSTANLSWSPSTDSGSGLKGYNVYRNGAYLRQVLVPATSATDGTLAAGNAYEYFVSAVDYSGNESDAAGPARLSTPACPDTVAPAMPTGVAAVAVNCSTISIVWNPSGDAGGSGMQGYKLYRNGSFMKMVSSPATSATDASVSAATGYSYSLSAVDNAGNVSPMSQSASVATPACADTTPPTIPGSVTATPASCSRVDVSWAASSDAGSGVRGYRVYRNSQLLQEVLAPASTFSDTTVAGAATYSYSVSAFDNSGNASNPSAAVNATTPGCGAASPGQFASLTTIGGTDSDYGVAVAVDRSGNIFVGGSVAGTPYLAKLSPAKQIVWSLQFPNAGSVQSIAVDPNGDVVFTGYFFGNVDFGGGTLINAGGYDIFVAKYSTDKRFIWANRYGSAFGADFAGEEAGNSLAIDASGNIAVAGGFYDSIDFGGGLLHSAGAKDGFVVKFAPNGTHLWSRSFGSTGSDDAATAVTFDAQGNLYVGGRFSPSADFGGGVLNSFGSYDAFVAKYTPSGTHIWSKRTGGTSFDTVGSLAVDRAGDVIVTGTFRLNANFDGVAVTGQGYEDVFLLKYNGTDGAQQWARAFGSWNTDMGNSVVADADNNITIAGRLGGAMDFGGGEVTTPRSGYNIYIAKFTPAGSHLWSKALGNGREEARTVVLDSRGFSFTVGRFASTNNFGGGIFSSAGNSSNPDIFVLELHP